MRCWIKAVTGGLPVHIAAKILGHHSLATTETYLAVFQDDLIRTYRAFLDKRRPVRPEAEYREPTAGESREFVEHFVLCSCQVVRSSGLDQLVGDSQSSVLR
jgi:hypothetical protein